MTNLADPAEHRRIETRLIEHVQRLINDPRLRIDTLAGTRPVHDYRRHISRGDRADEIRKTVGQLSRDESANLNNLPQGEVLDIAFGKTKMVVLFSLVARLRVVCTSPIKQLVRGEAIKPLTISEINRILEENKTKDAAPTTLVVLSTGGFSQDSHDLAQRMATRTLVLIEPNDAGGFNVWGPSETKTLNDLIDPEPETEKRSRIRDAVERSSAALDGDGIAVDRISAETRLPLTFVESEFRAIAKADKSLRIQRLNGRFVLHREGATPTGHAGGAATPMVERIKSNLSGRATVEKKMAYLNERRDALATQRDALDEELQLLEKKDAYLRQQFKEATSEPAKRRFAAQLYALRRKLDTRGKWMSTLNQQLNVLSIHLSNLTQTPDVLSGEDAQAVAAAVADAEETLGKMSVNVEPVDEPTAGASGGALLPEEQELFDELEREFAEERG